MTENLSRTTPQSFGVQWVRVRHFLLTIAAGSLLLACGGGGGGAVSVPVPAKALEILSIAVEKDERDVDIKQPVDPRVKFRFAFSATLGASGVSADRLQLSDGTRTYPVSTAIAGNTLTVTPTGNLHTSLNYTLTVKAGAVSADGSVLKSDYVLGFRTMVAVFENKQLTQGDRLVGSGPATRILIRDLNGDGRADLVKLGKLESGAGLRNNSYSISIFLQNTAGEFISSQKVEQILSPNNFTTQFNGFVVQDIDGDNKMEIIVPESPSESDVGAVAGIRIFKSDAGGKYSASDFIATPYVQSLQSMDVDGDGLIDLVGARGESAYGRTIAFQILRRTSSGFTILPPVEFPNGTYEFDVADLDLDGKRELIVNRRAYIDGTLKNELLIYSQGAPATFSLNAALTNEAVGFCKSMESCTKMKVADLNGDGKPELIFAGLRYVDPAYLGTVITFSRSAIEGLTKVSEVSLDYGTFYGQFFGIQDMDGDGIPDLLAVAVNYYGILESQSNSSWVFSNPILTPVSGTFYPSNVAIGDIDGDGLPDIIFDQPVLGIVAARQLNFRRNP
jgi:hypothetical protein